MLTSQNYDLSIIAVNNNNYSASSTKNLYFDQDGFLWYSTFNGVVKEMGSGNSQLFKYAVPKGKDIYTFDLLKSSKNKFWSATGEGLNVVDFNTGKSEWKTLKYPKTSTMVSFTALKEDKQGNIWLATDKNYLYCYNNTNQFTWIKIPQSDYPAKNKPYYGATTEIETILDDGSLILHQDKKWYRIKNKISNLIFDDSNFLETKKQIFTILIDNNSLFPSNSSGHYRYNDIEYQYKYVKEIDKQIIQVPFKNMKFIPQQDNENFSKKINFFAFENTKLIVLRLKKDEINNFSLHTEEVFTLKNKITNTVYSKAGYFFSHTEAGINKIRYNNIGFKKYLNDNNISCRGFSEDEQGNIYVFTYSGIFKLDKGKDDFKEIDNIQDIKSYKKVLSASYNFFKENDQTFWFYGFHDSIIKFNVNGGTFETYNFPFKKVVITDAECIDDSKLMLATSIGLYSFDFQSKTFKNESYLNEKINLDSISVVDLMLNKRKSSLWMATKNKNHALVKIDYATNIISSFGPEKKGMPIINNEITSIYEDQKSNLWLGTLNGLQKVNPINYKAKNFTIVDGLINDNICGVLEDDNYLWISTYNGLIKLNKETETIKTFHKEDGIPNNEFNRKSFLVSSQGTFYFGSLDGIVSFDPKIITKNDHSYKIFLSEYQKYDKKSNTTKAFYDSKGLVSIFNIPYQKNYLNLKFAINDLLNPEKNIYQYRITELSKKWVNLGNHNLFQIHGLKAGQYHLEVRGFSSNGNPTNILKYNINVTQVFYKKTWFITLIVLSLLGFLIIRNKMRELRIIKKYKREIKTHKLQFNAMKAQQNPRFVYDALVNLQEIMVNDGVEEAKRFFNIFSNFLGTKISMNHSEHILIKDEIEYLKSYIKLENLKLNNRIDVKFDIDNSIMQQTSKIPCMLLQPIIKDALINGIIPKKYDLKLSVYFKLKNKDTLVVEVIDNGITRTVDKKLKRKKQPQTITRMTSMMEKRIKLVNSMSTEKIKYSIVDIKSEGDHLGTKSTLILPLNNAFLQ